MHFKDCFSLRDCDITDRILVKCVKGLCNVRVVDLSGNYITHSGWRALADHLRSDRDNSRMTELVFQSSRHAIDQQAGEQLARIFSALNRLDLRRSVLTDEAVHSFIKVICERKTEKGMEKLDLTGCGFSKSSLEEFEEINRRKGSSLVMVGAFDDIESAKRGVSVSGCWRCLCCS